MTQLCLRWTNYESTILQVFQEMYEAHSLVDVTIGCERSSLKAHKMVLAASSPYFQALFMDNPCKHPIVILKDIKFDDLRALVEFMYRGEVTVSQEQLPSLLKAADTLQITRLQEVVTKPTVVPTEPQNVTTSLITYSRKRRKRTKADTKSTSETGGSGESDGETGDIQAKQEMTYVVETDSGPHVLTTSASGDGTLVEAAQEIHLVENRDSSVNQRTGTILELSVADVEQSEGGVAVTEMETSTTENEECKVTIEGSVVEPLNVFNMSSIFTSPGGSTQHAIVLLKKKQSFVWEHFSETGKGSVKCRKCGKLLAYKDSSGSTSNMIKHLKTVHAVERVSKPPLQE